MYLIPKLLTPRVACGVVRSVQLTLSPNTNYLVTVAITRSTNVGIPGNDDVMLCDIVFTSIWSFECIVIGMLLIYCCSNNEVWTYNICHILT